jgi:magnesium-transporting ATPase (P-type)
MINIIDPVRLEVKDSIEIFQQAGIRPAMIVGDHFLTAI